RPLTVIARALALHVEDRCVPIAGLGVIRARIGHVVDADDLEAALYLGLRGIAGAVDRDGERHGFAEFATIDLAAVQALDQIGDEAFHARPPSPASRPTPLIIEASSLEHFSVRLTQLLSCHCPAWLDAPVTNRPWILVALKSVPISTI